jgi:hypothetical protein
MTPAAVAGCDRVDIFVPEEFSSRHKPQQPEESDTVPFTNDVPPLKQHITRSPSATGTAYPIQLASVVEFTSDLKDCVKGEPAG